jgi:hypothetical protein
VTGRIAGTCPSRRCLRPCDAAYPCPDHLHRHPIRRLRMADPDRAWDGPQTMRESGNGSAWNHAIAAMDAAWGTGMDDTMATTLRTR